MHVEIASEISQKDVVGNAKPLDSTGQYLEEIGRFELLDGREAEVELFKLIEKGNEAKLEYIQHQQSTPDDNLNQDLISHIQLGEQARQEVWQKNLKLVVATAKKWAPPPGVELLDLIQEGNIGLEHAIRKFDHTKGFKFSTYAVWWINQRIRRHIQHRSNQIFPDTGTVLSLDASNDSGEVTILDFIDDKTNDIESNKVEEQTIVSHGSSGLLEILTDHEIEILLLTGGVNAQKLSDEKIAQKLGRSLSQIQYAKHQAIAKVQHPSNAHLVDKLDPNTGEQDKWQFKASCYGLGSAIGFFPSRGEPIEDTQKVCETCTVKTECLDITQDNPQFPGIWAGLSQRQRRALKESTD